MARYKSNKLNWPVFWISGILAYMGWHFSIPDLFLYSIVTFILFSVIIIDNALDNFEEHERRGHFDYDDDDE